MEDLGRSGVVGDDLKPRIDGHFCVIFKREPVNVAISNGGLCG
jgi:hypothetical protein